MGTLALGSRTWRKKPNFDTEEGRWSLKVGLFLAMMSVVVMLAIVTDPEDSFLSILVRLVFTVVAILQFGMSLILIWRGTSILIKKWRWIKAAVSAQGTIVTNEAEYYETGGYDAIGHETYALVVKPHYIQSASDLVEQVLWVDVSKRVYNNYAPGETVRLYYSRADAATFLLKGE
ncbi:hypothetical protein ANRL4_04914 [Anaerolineae bacterium]|nr:hypothetical protein ANRL4_04914 [Anaerolineae bacterium]